MRRDPATAPPRPDLTFLRRRAAVRTRPSTSIDYRHHEVGHAGAGAADGDGATVQPRPAPPVPSGSLDLSEPVPGGGSLEVSAPMAGGGSLDTSTRAAASLDLSTSPASLREHTTTDTRPAPPAERRPAPRRVAPSGRVVLDRRAPTVTLTRLQSGIGTLTVEAAVAREPGGLRIGCVYELTDGSTSIVSLADGRRAAPAESRRPALVAGSDRFEWLALDLRQCRSLSRVVVFGFAENRGPVNWGGTLLATTHTSARVEVPLDGLTGDVAVLLSIYQVRGELVLRGERSGGYGAVRDAARAFGFDAITWLDDRTPVS